MTLGIRIVADNMDRDTVVVSGYATEILPFFRVKITDGDVVRTVNGVPPSSFRGGGEAQ